jgi:hypothetical protein
MYSADAFVCGEREGYRIQRREALHKNITIAII